MTRWKDDNIERAIDDKQDGLLGNRLRLFVAARELPVVRRVFKGRFMPLALGRGAKLISVRAGVTVGAHGKTVLDRAVAYPVLAWLECLTWAVFGHAVLTWDEVAKLWMCSVQPLYQTPEGVDPVGVLGFERALVQTQRATPDARILAQYDAWLTGRNASAWSRANWVRDRLANVFADVRN